MRVGALFGLSAVLITMPAFAEVSANVGVASNYLWRGETQTADEAAVSGGLDYAHSSGLYIGTWVSNIGGEGNQDYEADLYGGYSRQWGATTLDLGAIAYFYPRESGIDAEEQPITRNDDDFSEIYLGVTFKSLAARYSYANDYLNTGENAYYAEVAFEYPIRNDAAVGLHYGYKDGDAFGDGYGDYSASLAKGPFTFLVSDLTDNDRADQSDNPRVVVSWVHHLDI